MDTGTGGAVASQDNGLSLVEAAARLGVSPRTLRPRIQREEIAAQLVQGDHGAEYRVWLGRTADRTTPVQASPRDGQAVSRLATMLEASQRELVAKAAAMWQARAELLAERVGALEQELALPAPTVDPPRRPWWHVWG